MGEQHKKHSRREHLNDFHLNVAGEYVYDGALYACQSDDTKQRRSKRAVWGMAAILTVAVAAGGCIPAPGMQNCFYVLLPYLGEFLGAVSVIWALAKLGMDWGTVQKPSVGGFDRIAANDDRLPCLFQHPGEGKFLNNLSTCSSFVLLCLLD